MRLLSCRRLRADISHIGTCLLFSTRLDRASSARGTRQFSSLAVTPSLLYTRLVVYRE
jgi:hypothetical protein